jgi:amidophosphoribosyltransferase
MPLDGAAEHCGLFAVHGAEDAAWLTCQGLIALQHRGQEAAGIVVSDRGRLRRHGGMGLVQQVFTDAALAGMPGGLALGHVRYSTAGGSAQRNVQPLLGSNAPGQSFALAHNGNLLSVGDDHVASGKQSWQAADTHVLAAALSGRPGQIGAVLRSVLPTLAGSFSIAVITSDTLFAARDPNGIRPLCLGRLDPGGWVVASESAALDCVGAQFVRELAPAELVSIDASGVRSEQFATARSCPCVFEHVYFARPDSLLGGSRVQQVRRNLGATLAAEAPAPATVVIPVPETARPAALGYAQASNLPFADGLIRNPYVGRTFIQPDRAGRRAAIRHKLNPVPEVVAGQRVALIDDSLVRANSSRIVIAMLRAAGATEVHLRIASPPVRWPCFLGVDIDATDLPARTRDQAQIAALVGADTVGYLSVPAMTRVVGGGTVCAGCFTGQYPVRAPASRQWLPPTGRPGAEPDGRYDTAGQPAAGRLLTLVSRDDAAGGGQ